MIFKEVKLTGTIPRILTGFSKRIVENEAAAVALKEWKLDNKSFSLPTSKILP